MHQCNLKLFALTLLPCLNILACGLFRFHIHPMKLSPAELSYLKESLVQNEPIRPDGRSISQFRPLEASIGFLPLANGSSRIRGSGGSECIAGVKAKVVRTDEEPNLVEVDVDITGMRDDNPMLALLSSTFQIALNKSTQLRDALRLTSKYSFKIFIDGVILSHSSYPFNLLSFAIYLALKSTRLPLLTSSVDDKTQEEVPTFNDDWDEARLLCQQYSPPLLFLVAVVGETILLDPTDVEEKVSETGIIVGLGQRSIVGPIRMLSLGGSMVAQDLHRAVVVKTLKLINESGKQVMSALDNIAASQNDSYDDAGISVF